MSNYYKGSISLSPNRLSEICKGILTPVSNTIPDISNNYFKQLGLPIVTATFSDVTTITINEHPNNLGYLYSGTDISQYCIAPYVESNGTTFTSIPSWCKNIRAILIGAGGNGETGQLGNIKHQQTTDTHIHELQIVINNNNRDLWNENDFYYTYFTHAIERHVNIHDGNYKQQDVRIANSNHKTWNKHSRHVDHATRNEQQAGASGGGGGGGGFVYLNNIQVEGKTVSIEGGGLSQLTRLTVQSTTYTGAKGENASGTTPGKSAGITGGGFRVVGAAGDGSTGGKSGFYNYLTTFPYGNGGDGGAGGVSGTSPDPSDGIPGQAGYYRIYFLT